jgi:CelD/BcsL family acetyltransferase involved in cellulose biosynthesis
LPEGSTLAVEEVPTPAGLEALRGEWRELWERTPAATTFQSPAWLIPWWRHFGSGNAVTLVLRDRARLVGLAPFYVLREPEGRKLLAQGIGVSDYLDPLLEPGREAAAAAAIMRHLADIGGRFDWADLEGLRHGSPLLAAEPPLGWTAPVGPREPCPVLALPASGAELSEHARSRLARLPYYRRRAERLGTALLESATRETLDATLGALADLHGGRWSGRGEPGVLADERVRAFHRDAACCLADEGLLRLYRLGIDGRPAAVFYGFTDRSRLHCYIGGFDSSLPHPGLGALMLGHAVEQAIGAGLREVHFLRGREPYKYAWGAVDLPMYGRRLARILAVS